LRVSSRKIEYMLRSKAAGEASVRKRLSHLVMRIVGAAIMSHPFVALDVHVRHVRMACLVHGDVVLGGRCGLLAACGGRSARRRGSLRGSGTAGRNVSTAHRRGATAAALLLAPLILLRKSSHANQE
jgi:hypothetical protein